MSELKIAMLVRQFSPHGGLELYAHKVVEGLLTNGIFVTVVCQENSSDLLHKNLSYKMMSPERKGSKSSRLRNLYSAANQALKELSEQGGVDLIHSQHCPTDRADVVTFHNHSTMRLNEVGLWWEAALNNSKRKFVRAYKLRDEHDEALLRHARCLIFPAEVMKEDFFSAYSFLQGPPPKPYVVAHPGASMSDSSSSSSAENTGQDLLGSGTGSNSSPNSGSNSSSNSGSNSGSNSSSNSSSNSGSDSNSDCSSSSAAPFNFLFVGRGFRKKGLDILLSACKILKQKSERPFTLSIAGLNAKPADVLRLNLLGLSDTVKYLGFQKDMNAVYAAAKSVILPSRVEPFGMAPVQAMQHGLVPIVSQVSGVAEVLHDGEDALILKNHLDAEELSSLMLKLMNENEFLKRLSSNSRVTAQKVSWDETVAQTMKAYEIAMGAKN